MRNKLLQAAILTLLLQLLALMSSPNKIQANSGSRLYKSKTPIVVLLNRLLKIPLPYQTNTRSLLLEGRSISH